MSKLQLLSLALASMFVGVEARAQFAESVVSYEPGTGFSPGFTNAEAALGEPSRVTPGNFGGPVDPFDPPYLTSQVVSIGAGGSLTIKFSKPVLDHPKNRFGIDFIIFGNTGFIITNVFDPNTFEWIGTPATDSSLFGNNPGTSRVSVSRDGITYYELNPAQAPIVDGLLPTDGSGDFHIPADPSLRQTDLAGLTLEGIQALYYGSAGGAGYDLSWAQDTDGRAVSLHAICYVRVEVLEGKAEVDGTAAVFVPGCDAPVIQVSSKMKRASVFCPRMLLSARSAGLPLAASIFCLSVGLALNAATITEDFAAEPLNYRWRVFGDSNLFTFNPAAQNLSVTWDSSHSNSYYYVQLENILSREDDFSVALDLELVDVSAGVNSNKPSTFELAFGFMNIGNTTKTNFYRGNSSLSPNLVEFDFFPDTGFGPTIWPSVWSTNSSLNYHGPGDYTILSLPTGIVMRVVMSYAASNQTLSTSVTTNGISIGAIGSVSLSSSFSDFRVNAFALESYSDAGQDPRYGGSLLAHGKVDNILVIIPPPPAQHLAVAFTNQQWQVSFTSRTNWLYAVERSIDLQGWATASTLLPGNGQKIFWQDPNAPSTKAFYRVRAEKP